MDNPVPKRLAGPVNAASGDNTLLTVDPGHTYEVTRVKIVNNTTAKVTVKIGINDTTDASLVMVPVGVPRQGQVDLPTYEVLNQNDLLVANATATGTTVTVYGNDRYPRV